MFQFPHLPPPPLYIQGGVTGYHPGGVAPFGYPRISARPQLPEAFRRLATSFVGSRRQGIHRVLFLRSARVEFRLVVGEFLANAVNGTRHQPAFVALLHRCVDFLVVVFFSHGAPMHSVVNVLPPKKADSKAGEVALAS
jgi:hypothetical protein